MINEIETQKNKRILITSTDVMMLQFLVQHVFYLKEKGFDVEVACSEVEGHIKELKEIFSDKVVFNIIDSERSPFSLKNIKGYKQLKRLISKGDYDLIWTNEPVMGILTRFAARRARKRGTKVMYIAHGFHFYKGSSLARWLIFYPIEKIAARFTDKMITLNHEDYNLALMKFKKCRPERFNGIGIDTKKFMRTGIDTLEKRKELGVSADSVLFVSVAELEKRKNHDTVIRAFAAADIDNSCLLICGVGTQKDKLQNLIAKLDVSDKVKLLGYRYDIRELLETADVFVLGSYQEGLSVAIMEAMAMGDVCVVSRIRGNIDLIDENNGFFFDPKNVLSAKHALIEASGQIYSFDNEKLENEKKIKDFDSEIILEKIAETVISLVGDDA